MDTIIQGTFDFNSIPYGYCQCGCGKPAQISNRSTTRYGYVTGKPRRFIRGHSSRARFAGWKGTVEERFWRRVDRTSSPNGCWLWTGCTRSGYGAIHINHISFAAHRISYEMHKGAITGGLWVLHNCPGGDNRLCVNPAHLWLGTAAENVHDAIKKGRGNGAKGKTNYNARLTADMVRTIRTEYAQGTRIAHLAKRFGVVPRSIRAVINRETWAHIP